MTLTAPSPDGSPQTTTSDREFIDDMVAIDRLWWQAPSGTNRDAIKRAFYAGKQHAKQHAKPQITGYRHLSAEETNLINEIKAQGEALGKLVELLRGTPESSLRWISIGETHLQQGLMALTRAVARPTTF